MLNKEKVLEIFKVVKNNHYENLVKDKCSSDTYHLEGNTWTHTMMCMSQALTYNSTKMALISLLHDIGKPMSRKYNKDGKPIGHSNVSMGLSYNLLKDHIKNPKELIEILYLINHHGLIYENPKIFNQYLYDHYELRKDLINFRDIDLLGSLRFNKEIETPIEPYKFEATINNNKNKPNLWVYIGLPGSGKSTYYTKHHKGINRFNNDDMMLRLCEKEGLDTSDYNNCWSYCFDNELMTPEIVSKAQEKQLNLKKDLVIDNTNLSFKIRKRFKNYQKNYNINYIVFLNSLNILEERNLLRKKVDNKYVPLEMLMLTYQLPFKNELGGNNISIKFILDNKKEISYEEVFEN